MTVARKTTNDGSCCTSSGGHKLPLLLSSVPVHYCKVPTDCYVQQIVKENQCCFNHKTFRFQYIKQPVTTNIKTSKRKRSRSLILSSCYYSYYIATMIISTLIRKDLVINSLKSGGMKTTRTTQKVPGVFRSPQYLDCWNNRKRQRQINLFPFNYQYGSCFPRNYYTTLSESSDQYQQSNPPVQLNRDVQLHQKMLAEKNTILKNSSKLSLAPMMEYTDRHFRHLIRLLSSRTLLYTEMVPANAVARERQDSIERYLKGKYYVDCGEQAPSNTPVLEPSDDGNQRRTTSNQRYDNCDPNMLADAVQNYEASYLHRFLGQSQMEPLDGACVLQVGGSNPQQLFEAAQCVTELSTWGRSDWSKNEKVMCDYTAINLNCGCPSPKVANQGCFGAALMDEPQLVKELTQSLYEGSDGRLPVTVKCRIGTDTYLPAKFNKLSYTDEKNRELIEEEEYERLCHFIETVASNGIVTDFQIHARIAVLQKSFSPADNRKIPPLKHHLVHRLARDYPNYTFTLNGGIESLTEVRNALEQSTTSPLHGVMVGRAFAADPWSFSMVDQILYNEKKEGRWYQNRYDILERYGRHADLEETLWDPLRIRRFIINAITPLFTGEQNAKRYRIALDDIVRNLKKSSSLSTGTKTTPISTLIMNAALEHLSDEVLMRTPEESYERMMWEEDKVRQREQNKEKQFVVFSGSSEPQPDESNHVVVNEPETTYRSQAITEWQTRRKENESIIASENVEVFTTIHERTDEII